MKALHDVGGRSEAPFAVSFLHRVPLVVEVERQGAGHALALFEQAAAGDDESESRHALDALVGAADEEVDAQRGHVDGHAAEAAHGVDDERLAVAFDDFGHSGQRIEHAGGRLAVDD